MSHVIAHADSHSTHLIKSVVLFHAAATGPVHEPTILKALNRFVEDLGPQWKQPMVDNTGFKLVASTTASLVSYPINKALKSQLDHSKPSFSVRKCTSMAQTSMPSRSPRSWNRYERCWVS